MDWELSAINLQLWPFASTWDCSDSFHLQLVGQRLNRHTRIWKHLRTFSHCICPVLLCSSPYTPVVGMRFFFWPQICFFKPNALALFLNCSALARVCMSRFFGHAMIVRFFMSGQIIELVDDNLSYQESSYNFVIFVRSIATDLYDSDRPQTSIVSSF